MEHSEVDELSSEAEKVVQDACSRLMRTLGEFGYSGNENIAFVQLAASKLLGGSLDLWLETQCGDTETLGRFVCARIEAKKARDGYAKKRDLH
tara:strand:- start:1023 stop:1301 length:279 start_codon:yes stop_codon:yes gene_type:complete